MEETSSAVPCSMFDYRMSLRAAGYAPIPVAGKRPALKGWQTKGEANAAEIAEWGASFPGCTNTGILTERTPALDIDIRFQEVADAVSDLVRELYGDKGTLLTRFGSLPKRAILFRTDQPFSKQRVAFTAQDGTSHAVEFLGSGQQIVVDGIHPDTHKPYAWHGGYAPGAIRWDDLPEIGEEEAATLLNLIAEMLAERFWFQEQQTSSTTPLHEGGIADPVNVTTELATMADGTVNAVQTRVIPSLLHKMHPDEVLELVVNATMEMANRNSLGWSRDEETLAVRKRILSAYNNLLLKDYDHTTGVIPGWLPGEFHEPWAARLQDGVRPVFGFNRGGFYIRTRQREGHEGGASYSERVVPFDEVASGETQGQHKTAPPPHKPAARRVLQLRPFIPFDISKLPPRTWLYAKHYQRRTVSLTAGPGGMGKSSLTMVEAVAMCTLRNLLGEQPEERLRIWLHNGEDPLDEIHRRLAAICQHYEISQEELQGYLWVTSGNEFPLRVAKGYTNLEIDTALVRQISGAISDNQIDLAVFDPFVTLHSVSEVDPGKMDMVIRLFGGIADENDSGVELAHHVRKPAAGTAADYDVHDIRGVAAITDAVRAARVLNRMNQKDAEAAGCGETERLSRFRVDRAKGNYSKATAATWRQFVSVELPNGDDVGVVAPWNYPGQGEDTPEKVAADQKADQVFTALLDKFTARGTNVSANPSSTYAPARFAKEHEAKAAKVSKAALVGAMNRLLDAGRIRSEPTAGDKSSRLVAWHGDAE
jgi:AAA domain/Bifunctional DNA primase/polymerase, N-terminal